MVHGHVHTVRVSGLVALGAHTARVHNLLFGVPDLDVVVHVSGLGHVVADAAHPSSLPYVQHFVPYLGIHF